MYNILIDSCMIDVHYIEYVPLNINGQYFINLKQYQWSNNFTALYIQNISLNERYCYQYIHIYFSLIFN